MHTDVKLVCYHAELRPQFENYYLSNDDLNYTGHPSDAIATSENDSHRYPIIIEQNGVAVGFFILHDWEGVKKYGKNRYAMLLRSYSIDSRYQGKGIAKQSLKILPTFMKENFPSITEVVLAVNKQNRHAQYVYKKCGFKDKGLRVMGRKGEQFVLHRDIR